MAFKTGVLVLVLAILGIFEVQAASIAAETEMWNNLDADSDEDMRTVNKEDDTDSDFISEGDEKGTVTRDDIASDVAAAVDYYNNAVESRALCKDAFPNLCVRLGKCSILGNRKMAYFAKRFCHHTCSQFCK